MDICGKDALWIPEGNCECPGGGGPAITKVLHSQLVALQQANMLEPGMQYRIIDYECTTTQEGTDVVQHPFDIVVVADDENTLNENARAMLRDGDVYYASTDIDAWELKYTVDNDQSRFGWADPVNGKGVVYYMRDEFDNVAPYDFKQIVFERYEILDVLSELVDLSSMEHNFISMNAAKGGDTPGPVRSAKGEKKAPVKTTAKESAKATVLRAADGQAVGMFVLPYLPVYAFTFSNIADGVITDASVGQYDLCRNNIIGQSIEQQFEPHYILPDNVFINRSDDIGGVVYEGNVIGINSEGNTFGSGAFYNAIGDGCSFITAAHALSDTTIGNSVAEVCLGVVCQGNVIGENSHEVYIDEHSYRNQIGADCTNIIIGSGDYDNHIGNHCSDILLGNSSSINSIGDTCSNITILEDTYNKVGAGCYDIYLDRAEANTFGTLCTGFYLQRGSGHNTFGNTCHDITLGEYVQHSTFEDNVAYISIGDLFSDLTFETGVQYVTLPGINSGVYRYYFLTGTKGTAADPITFTPVAAPYTRYVGLNSQGNLEIWNPADGGVPVGAPVIVNSVSAMTDTSKIYLYTGSEAGYTAGDWYYWDGAAWVSGGVYGGSSVVIDNTLTRTGEAADAKVTGDRLDAVENNLAPVESTTTATRNYAVGDYVIVNNQLYQVTVAIPTSGTITPGTNVVSISVDEVLKDLEKRIDAAFVTDKASGALAYFEDGADDIPVKDLKIGIEPVQDLQGYDHPWPAGGGKNKCPDKKVQGSSGTVYIGQDNTTDFPFSLVGGQQYTLSMVTSKSFTVYLREENAQSGTAIGNSLPLTFTPSTSGNYRIALSVSGLTPSDISNVQLESGTTATAYAPYSNIAPITGWTGANVTRRGKNQTNNNSLVSLTNGALNVSGNGIIGYLAAGQTYTISFDILVPSISGAAVNNRLGLYYNNTTTVGRWDLNTIGHQVLTFIPSTNCYINFWSGAIWTPNTRVLDNIQLELGSTATAYEPYTAKTYPISFGSAGTVYGGTLDVTIGVLTATHRLITFNDIAANIGYNSGGYFWASVGDKAAGNVNIISSAYNVVDVLSVSNLADGQMKGHPSTTNIYWKDARYTTEQAFIAAMGNQTICYELATPITYQITPTEVSTLLGINNIWADTGDTEVEYRADTKLYIEQLTKPTEDDMIANAAIQNGKFFMVGNRLFLSTAAIASGDTINPGTNCTELSLADALNNLN